MTLDLLINQVLEKDAACFLQCETRSIEAGAAKTWGGWIPTSNCWQHRTPQSKHWITEAEQWSRGPTWMTLTQLNLLSVWSNFHKYWAKGIVGKYMPHISQTPSRSLNAPQLPQRPLSHTSPPPSRRFRSTTFSKSSRLASHPWSLACPVSEMWGVFGRLWVRTGCKGGLVHLCWSDSRFRATPTSPCLFPNCASIESKFPVWLPSLS